MDMQVENDACTHHGTVFKTLRPGHRCSHPDHLTNGAAGRAGSGKPGEHMKANIKLPLDRMRPVDLEALSLNVVANMTDNPDFATPAVPLRDLAEAADKLEQLIQQATNGSRQSKLLRDDQVVVVQALLRAQADYVRSVCAGDRTKLESSGFELTRQREPIGIPGTPQRMEARFTGLKGEVKLRWHSVHGARGYQVWMTDQDPANGGKWQAIGYSTRVSHLITDLESYKAYFFCVSAIGAAGEGAQSDPALGRAA